MKTICFVLFLLIVYQVSAGSDDTVMDRLYISDRQVLKISSDKQLTLGRNITGILPNPGGTRIAFVSDVQTDDDETTTISTIGLVKYEVRDYCTVKLIDGSGAKIDEATSWSPDGRFLTFTIDNLSPTVFNEDVGILDVSKGTIVILGERAGGRTSFWGRSWGDGDQVAFGCQTSDGWSIDVYDPANDKLVSWPRQSSEPVVRGWTRSSQIVFYDRGTKKHLLLDPLTGLTDSDPRTTADDIQSTPVGGTADQLTVPGTSAVVNINIADKIGPAISADGVSHKELVDNVWLDVHGLAPMKKNRPSEAFMLVDSFLNGSQSVFVPHSSETPSTQIALLANGNLYLSTLAFDNSTLTEAIDAGDNVPCKEEELLAASDAKQLGLALLQYAEDYDNTLPPTANFHDEVFPYIKDDSVFQVDRYPFVYQLNGEDGDSFADKSKIVCGVLTLPCGKVTLFLDGHVTGTTMQNASSSIEMKKTKRLAANMQKTGCGCGS